MFNTIAPIAESLAKGWGAKTILKKLAQKFPKLSPFVHAAEVAGFSSPSILRKLMHPDQSADALTEREQVMRKDKNTKRNLALGAVGTLGLVGAGIAGVSKLGQIGARAQGAQAAQTLPPGGGGPPSGGPGGIGPTGSTPPPSPFSGAQKIAGQLPSSTETHFPHLVDFVQRLADAGKPPEEIYSLAKQSRMLGPLVQNYEAKEGHSFLERIKQMSTEASKKKKKKKRKR